MKIIIDNKIPFLKGLLEPLATVEYVQGDKISNEVARDADAIIIRTRTLCNAGLLRDTEVKFVGSSTIGTDHIDTDWCLGRGIFIASAPGCNSGSVMQYLCSSLIYLINKYDIEPGKTTIGIIGVGNVGSKVAAMAETLGFNVLLNDPPREQAEGSSGFVPLGKLLDVSDIVSLHVPLTLKGKHRTRRMADRIFFKMMKKGSILINTSRGDVVDEKPLLEAMQDGKIKAAVLDVWKNEPEINKALLDRVDLGTAHIAGYSADGKANGSMMVVRQLAEYFDLPLKSWLPENIMPPEKPLIDLRDCSGDEMELISKAVFHTYDIEKDSKLLKSNPGDFEKLRGDYPNRREYHAYKVKGDNNLLINKLKALGFR